MVKQDNWSFGGFGCSAVVSVPKLHIGGKFVD
jgi:putative transposon-encoded protein